MSLPKIVPNLSLLGQAATVPAEYRALCRYLTDRYADTVVLSFDQIESLVGASLPEGALSAEWWTTGHVDAGHPGHFRSWTEAGRSARVNVFARNVVFDRLPPPRVPAR